MGHGILIQGFIIPNLVNEYKTIFLRKRVDQMLVDQKVKTK